MFFSRNVKHKFLNPFYVNNFVTVQFLIRLEYNMCNCVS